MSWFVAGYVLLLFVGVPALLGLAAFVWRQRAAMASMRALTIWLLVLTAWCAAYLLFLISPDRGSQEFWFRARQLASVWQAATVLPVALCFSGRGRWVTPRLLTLLGLEALLAWTAILTTDLHGLWWRAVLPNSAGPYPPLVAVLGVWASVRMLYAHTISAASLLLLLLSLWRSSTSYRRQITLLLLAATIPWAGSLVTGLGLSPVPGLDLTPGGYAVMALAWAGGILRGRLFDIVPVARSAVFEDMQDAVLVAHAQGRIIDANPAALLLLGRSAAECLGRSTHEVLAGWPALLDCLRNGAAPAELVVEVGPEPRSIEFRVAPWHDAQQQPVGWLVIGRDVTHRRQTRELTLLNALKEETSRLLSVAEVLHAVQRLLAQTLGHRAGWIFLYDEANDQLLLQTSWGLPAEAAERYGACPVAAFTSPATVWEQRTVAHANLPAGLAAAGQRQALCFPLSAQGEVQGVVELFSSAETPFADHETALLTLIGQDAGGALRNARLYEQVEASRRELQQVSQMLVDVQEAERQHLASELHDEIGQSLTALRLLLGRARLAAGEGSAPELQQADAVTQDLIRKVREMSLDLRPAMLDDLGLKPALLWQFDRYTALTGIRVAFRGAGLERRFPPRVEVTVYRIIQEALTNVARHAGAPEAAVQIWADARSLSLQVEDHGAGFPAAEMLARGATSGLAGMRQRATAMGGHLTVESAPGRGARISVDLPLHRPQTEAPVR